MLLLLLECCKDDGLLYGKCIPGLLLLCAVVSRSKPFLSVQIPGYASEGGRIVLGNNQGWGRVWWVSTGDPLCNFPIADPDVSERRDEIMSAQSHLPCTALRGDWHDNDDSRALVRVGRGLDDPD